VSGNIALVGEVDPDARDGGFVPPAMSKHCGAHDQQREES
jgi:hypothetical protein